jgi:ribosome maturation factor RimP
VGLARFFLARNGVVSKVKPSAEEIENRIAEIDSEVEFLAVEPAGRGGLRIYIDHPGGVNLGICQDVTSGLGELLEEFSIEVSSPGPQRPLTKSEHFERFKGRRAKVRTVEPIDGRRNFTGTILDTDGDGVTLGCDGTVVQIPHRNVERSHLAPDTSEGAAN